MRPMTAKRQWVLIALYAAASLVVFMTTVAIDAFAIFDNLYLWLACGLPFLAVVIVLVAGQWRWRRAGWVSTVFACLAAAGIGFCHIALIAMMSAGV